MSGVPSVRVLSMRAAEVRFHILVGALDDQK